MALTYGILNGAYTASQFSEMAYEAFGNGICDYGGKFSVNALGANGISVGTGFAILNGYWIRNSTAQSFYVSYSDTIGSRYDSVVLRVDFVNRAADIVLVRGTASSNPIQYEPVRNNEYYELVLAYIYVTPATTLISVSNVIDTRNDSDLCGMISIYSSVSKDALSVYYFAATGFSNELLELIEAAEAEKNALISQIENTGLITSLNNALVSLSNHSYKIGTMLMAVERPAAENWLLCDGSAVPTRYSALRALIGNVLPAVSLKDSRMSAWIYAGVPA